MTKVGLSHQTSYPHEQIGHHVGQQYVPTALLGTYFYSPSEQGYEAQVKDRLARWRAAQENVSALAAACRALI